MYRKDGAAAATAHTYWRFNVQKLITYLTGFFNQSVRFSREQKAGTNLPPSSTDIQSQGDLACH